MNMEICKRCERRPDVYVVISIDNGIATLNGVKYGGHHCCLCHTKDEKEIDKLSENLIENIFKSVFIEPDVVFNDKYYVDKECSYFVEQELSK